MKLSPETEAEIDRAFRNLTFFETRNSERIVVEGKLTKEAPKKKLGDSRE
jgi:hypothetical protein